MEWPDENGENDKDLYWVIIGIGVVLIGGFALCKIILALFFGG